MQYKKIEPTVRRLFGPKKTDFLLNKRSMKALIADISETIKSKLRATFLKQDGMNFDIINLLAASKVINKPCDA